MSIQTDSIRASLSRAFHTANVVDEDLYIWGGLTAAEGPLASNDMHIIKLSKKDENSSQYRCIPALGRDGEKQDVPQARARHTSCSIGERILIFGGTLDVRTQQPIEEGTSRVWVFDCKLLSWSAVDAETGPAARSGHQAVAYDDKVMIIHGGVGAQSQQLRDTWAFNIQSGTWSQLPDLPKDASASHPDTASLAEANGTLYIVTHSSNLTATTHTLDLKNAATPRWQTTEIPITFPNPGPRSRKGAGMITLHTGQGRVYLLYIFGASPEDDTAETDAAAKMWSGMWALQLPASGAAHAKDAVRDSVGLDSKESSWAEVEIVAGEQATSMEGKAHPGPRAYFGCDIVKSSQKILLWGGMRPDGSYAGDGWVINFNSPSIRGILHKTPVVGRFIKGDD